MANKSQFHKFLKDIEPSATTKADAKAAHEEIREFLKNNEAVKDTIRKITLSGSSYRDTAIRPKAKEGQIERPDIDILIHTYHQLSDEPADVIDFLFSGLKAKYEEIRKQARSIGISTARVDMDIVPIICPDPSSGVLYVPDRKLETWVITNPPGHSEWASEMNKLSEGRFKPLVKMFKWWRRENPTISNKPKGFMLETLVAECMDFSEESYEELFVKTLEALVSHYSDALASETTPFVNDPGVPGNNVLSKVTPDAFAGFINKARVTAEWIRTAQLEEDPSKELEIWRNHVFGVRFPAPVTAIAEGEKLRAATLAGNLVFDPSTGNFQITSDRNQGVSYRPQRFHGELGVDD